MELRKLVKLSNQNYCWFKLEIEDDSQHYFNEESDWRYDFYIYVGIKKRIFFINYIDWKLFDHKLVVTQFKLEFKEPTLLFDSFQALEIFLKFIKESSSNPVVSVCDRPLKINTSRD